MASSMTGVLRALTRIPRRGRGRVLMVIGAQPETGVSAAARDLAEAAGAAATTLLLDLDLRRSGQHRAFAEAALRDGPVLSARIDGRLKGAALYRIMTADGRVRPEPQSALGFFRVGRSKLFVSGFDPQALNEGERAQIMAGVGYWDAVRQSCDLCVLDSPSPARSRLGLTVAPHVDAVAIVVSGASDNAVTAAAGLKAELEAKSVPILGLIYTGADPMALNLERLLPI